MTAAQASVGTAATWPTNGTIFKPAIPNNRLPPHADTAIANLTIAACLQEPITKSGPILTV